MNRNKHTENGFTLVELMATLAIGALLMTVAAPGFKAMFSNNRITQQVNEFVFAINYGRSEAAKLNQRVVLCRSTNPTVPVPSCDTGAGNANNWGNGWILFADVNTNSTFEAGDILLRAGAASNSSVQIRTNNAANRNLQINSNGSTNEGGNIAIIAVCDDRDGDNDFDEQFGKQVQVQPSGHVQMVTSPIPDCANPTT